MGARMARVKRKQPERLEQIKLSVWLTKEGIRHTASANGAKRSIPEAMTLKRMGMSAGFPDVEIPYARGCYHGMYIEMKPVEKGKVSRAQSEWLAFLTEQGYYAQVCRGFEEAREMVNYYFSLTK